METLEAIAARRSIRRFLDRPVPRDAIEAILAAAIQAPSAKNAQPWRFVVLEGEEARQLAYIMQTSAARLTEAGADTGSLPWTAAIVEQAPVTILVYDARPPAEVPEQFHADYRFVMLQSIGAAIQNMLLAAEALGLGSLWICDVLYCEDEISQWLGHAGDALVAGVTLGYAAESPHARPRRPWQELTQWRGATPQGTPR
jgi:F420 biosynthesis protein FbiB-like protein